MPRRRRYPEVAAALRHVLDTLGPVPLNDWLTRYFERPGWVLSTNDIPRWPRFVMEPARMLGAPSATSAQAAVLVELIVAAIDIADDLVDGDWQADAEDQHRATNAIAGVALLTQAAHAELARALEPARARRILEHASQWSLASVTGQDRDIVNQRRVDVTEDEAIAVTRAKSGSLVRMACEIGAMLATDDLAVVDAVGTLGSAVGTIAQLLNDLAGVDTQAGQKTDFRARTKTAPVAFLLRSARDEQNHPVLNWYATPTQSQTATEDDLSRFAIERGAVDFAWVLADAERRDAMNALRAAAASLNRPELLELRSLLPSVRARGAV